MFKRLAILAFIATIIGCDEGARNTGSSVAIIGEEKVYVVAIKGDNPTSSYRVVVIDGCEYLYCLRTDSPSITHKGNCKNHSGHGSFQVPVRN